MVIKSDDIKKMAGRVGFDLCGIARARSMDEWRERFSWWLGLNMDAGLDYLKRNVDKRFEPQLLVENAASVVVCGVVYKNDTSLDPGRDNPKIASYARAADYHNVIKKMLSELAGLISEEYGDIVYRAFTDSAPVAEKSWAVEAGLGWIGRNSLLINPEQGSFLLLGELIMAVSSDEYDAPRTVAGCGGCRRCVDACPNGAIGEWGVDLRKCISRHTASREPKSTQPPSADVGLHGWVYGCDICQSVCPYNSHSPLVVNPLLQPKFDPRDYSVSDWLALSDEEFDAVFGETPLASNSSPERIKRYVREAFSIE